MHNPVASLQWGRLVDRGMARAALAGMPGPEAPRSSDSRETRVVRGLSKFERARGRRKSMPSLAAYLPLRAPASGSFQRVPASSGSSETALRLSTVDLEPFDDVAAPCRDRAARRWLLLSLVMVIMLLGGGAYAYANIPGELRPQREVAPIPAASSEGAAVMASGASADRRVPVVSAEPLPAVVVRPLPPRSAPVVTVEPAPKITEKPIEPRAEAKRAKWRHTLIRLESVPPGAAFFVNGRQLHGAVARVRANSMVALVVQRRGYTPWLRRVYVGARGRFVRVQLKRSAHGRRHGP